MLNAFIRLWRHLESRRKRQLLGLLLLMLLASLAEMFSIGAVIPFLAVMASPEQALAQPTIRWLANTVGIFEPVQLLAAIAVCFGVAALFAAAVRVLLIYTSANLSYTIGASMSSRIYRHTLYQPYIKHLNRNSSEVIAGITSKSENVIGGALVPGLMIVSSGMLLLTIVSMLAWINPLITLGATVIFGGIYVTMTYFMKRQLARNSKQISDGAVRVLRCLQEGLGGLREVLLEGNQQLYCEEYGKADRIMRKAQGSNLFIAQFPRYAIEGLGLFLIAMYAFYQSRLSGGLDDMLPKLGALALGASRLLPVLQHAYGSWASIQGCLEDVEDVLALLDEDSSHINATVSVSRFVFTEQISLHKMSFAYRDESVLQDVSLTIRKGDCVGIIGRSGGGKSTLVDVIMGLLVPTDGTLSVDGNRLAPSNLRSWQMHIAHVPQTIFLIDGTIADNIVFGMAGSEPSPDELYQIILAVGLGDLVRNVDDLYRISVGERGARISGGQRQRIAIARALVRKADLIVLDEATSALDEKTEAEIISMLQRLDKSKTIIMISHRLAAIRHCNRIFRVENGRVREDDPTTIFFDFIEQRTS
jgi:ATP-binding cassette, subfamily B, bacterial PglK